MATRDLAQAVAGEQGPRRLELRFDPPLIVRSADALSRLSWLAFAACGLVSAMTRRRA